MSKPLKKDYNTVIQNQQIELLYKRLQIEAQLSKSKMIANKDKSVIKTVLPKVKLSKDQIKELKQRSNRLAQEVKLSNQKAEAQKNIEDGIIEPIADTRSFAEKQADDTYQQSEALKNVNKLISDTSEAQRLLKYLIVDNDLLVSFNTNFPRLYREIKANYTEIGAREALLEIQKLLKMVADNSTNPLNTKSFNDGIKEILKEVKSLFQETKDQNYKDVAMKLEALQIVRNSLPDDKKADFDNLLNVDAGSLTDIYENLTDIVQTQNNPMLQAVDEGSLDQFENASMLTNDDTADTYDTNDDTIVSLGDQDIEQMLLSDNKDNVNKAVKHISQMYEVPEKKIKALLRSGLDVLDDYLQKSREDDINNLNKQMDAMSLEDTRKQQERDAIGAYNKQQEEAEELIVKMNYFQDSLRDFENYTTRPPLKQFYNFLAHELNMNTLSTKLQVTTSNLKNRIIDVLNNKFAELTDLGFNY